MKYHTFAIDRSPAWEKPFLAPGKWKKPPFWGGAAVLFFLFAIFSGCKGPVVSVVNPALTITGLPDGDTYEVYVFTSSEDLSSFTPLSDAVNGVNGDKSKSIAESTRRSGNSFPLYSSSSSGTSYWYASGKHQVVLKNTAGKISDLSNPIYRLAEVTFTNGVGSKNLNEFTAQLGNGPSEGGESAQVTINFTDAESGDIVLEWGTPFQVTTVPSVTELENEKWTNGEVNAGTDIAKYQFYAVAGRTYRIYLNDKSEGDKTKNGDVGIDAYWNDRATADLFLVDTADRAWLTPAQFTADKSGVVIVEIKPHEAADAHAGTYAVKYGYDYAVSETPAALEVKVSGSYPTGTTFRWILDGGVEQDGIKQSITLRREDLAAGPHRLTVIAFPGAKIYSRELTFVIGE